MKLLFYTTIIFVAKFFSYCNGSKLVCYYDTTSASRVGPGKFTPQDLELASQFCTHIIYSYVTIIPKAFTITAMTSEREHELANMQLFKNKYPNIKFLLSLSGENNWKTTRLFLDLLEADQQKKNIFIKSIMKVLDRYKFDGLSLDLPLPAEKPIPHDTFWSKMWRYFLDLFRTNCEQDSKVNEHKNQLTTLIQQLGANMQEQKGLLSLNVLPNIDSRKYFDIAEIIKNLDFVVLSAFDFYTPQRNPHEADLMSPTKPIEHQSYTDYPLANIKNLHKYWHSQTAPRHKIIIGIAAYGRAWKMTKNSNSDGVPPVFYTDGPAAGGPQTQTPGFLSWPEICEKLSHDPKFRRVTDPKAKSGVYAFRPTDSRGNFGIWISYEDPITTGAKAMYVRNHNLGGVALFHLSLDDAHGECSGEKFPILRSINFKLTKFLS